MNYTPLTWYEQEYLRYKAHSEALPWSLRLFTLKVGSQRYSRRSYRPVHQFIKTITQCFQVQIVHLATAYVDIKECAVTKEFCIYSFPIVSACNLLNQIYILTANLKFPLCQHKTQVTQIRSPKFDSSNKILNANQTLISYFLSIHYITFDCRKKK
jgi:hypothetical protein